MSRKKRYTPKTWERVGGDRQHVSIYQSMCQSDAWRNLSHAAIRVYLIMKSQYRGDYTGDTVTCPYKVIKENAPGMNNKTISRAIGELETKGFIIIDRGTFVTGNLKNEPNRYKFSDKWRTYKTEPP